MSDETRAEEHTTRVGKMPSSVGRSHPLVRSCLLIALVGGVVHQGLVHGDSALSGAALPAAETVGQVSLEEALASKPPRGRARKKALPMAVVGQMLWASQRISLPTKGVRATRSSLRLYVLLPTDYYYYEPNGHQLSQRSAMDLRKELWRAVEEPSWLASAPAMFLIASGYGRAQLQFGTRARQLVYMAAGQMAQNLVLQSSTLGLHGGGAFAFDSVRSRKTQDLPMEEELLHVLVFGEPLARGGKP